MFQTVYLGKILGIKIYIHWTFWILALYIALSNLGQGLNAALSAVTFVFAIFGCVFLHEMGHATAGKWFQIQTEDITLYPIGGVARMADFTRSPLAELVVTLAGPMVNVIIASVLFIGLSVRANIEQVTALEEATLGSFWQQLLVANVALAVFNMLPAFPMDGGRVLRSVLAMFLPYSLATRYAARVGQFMAVMMFFISLYLFSLPLTIISIMVFAVCTGELLKDKLARVAMQIERGAGPFSQGDSFVSTPVDTIDAEEVREVR